MKLIEAAVSGYLAGVKTGKQFALRNAEPEGRLALKQVSKFFQDETMPTLGIVGRSAVAGCSLCRWASDCCRRIRLLERLYTFATFMQEVRHAAR